MIKEKYLFNATMVLTFFIPTTIYYLFVTSSQAIGLAISIIFLLPFIMKNLYRLTFTRNELFFLSISLTYIMFIMLYNSIYIHEYNIMKFFFGLVLIIVMILTAKLLAVYIQDCKIELDLVIKSVFFVLIAIAFTISLRNIIFDVNINAYQNKHLFIFREPSHFALLFTPLLIYHFVQSELSGKLTYFFMGLFFAFFIKSLLLIVGVLLMISIILHQHKTIVFVLIPLLLLSFSAISSSLPDYFLDRIILTTNTNNLSVLVYLNGWERLLLNLNTSNFFGIGLQQLGFIGDNGMLMEKIELLAGSQLNLYDGSFLASKIVSELGILGLFYLSIYLLYSFKALKFFTANEHHDSKLVLAYSFIFCFFIELFFRGIGYFSFSLFMTIASYYYITLNQKDENDINNNPNI